MRQASTSITFGHHAQVHSLLLLLLLFTRPQDRLDQLRVEGVAVHFQDIYPKPAARTDTEVPRQQLRHVPSAQVPRGERDVVAREVAHEGRTRAAAAFPFTGCSRRGSGSSSSRPRYGVAPDGPHKFFL